MEEKIHEALQELRSTLGKEKIIKSLDELETEYDMHIDGQELIFQKLDPEERKNLRQKYFEKIKKLDKGFQSSDLYEQTDYYEIILACYRKRYEDAKYYSDELEKALEKERQKNLRLNEQIQFLKEDFGE